MSRNEGGGKGVVGQAWPPQVCARLELIQQTRDAMKGEEADLRKNRKAVKEELLELGAGESENHLQLSREYVVTIFRLDYVRARLNKLADQADQTVRRAKQPELFEDDDSDITGPKRLTEKSVFAGLRKAAAEQKTFESDDDDEDEGESDDAEEKSAGGGGGGGRGKKRAGIAADMFPAVFRLTPTPKHPVAGAKEALIEADNLANLRTAIDKSLGAKADRIESKTGDVYHGDSVALLVTYVKPIAA